MKTFIILITLLSTNFAMAQSSGSSILPDLSMLKTLFNTQPDSKIQQAKFRFMSPNKEKGKGRWSVTCYLPNGEINPLINNFQAQELHTGFVDYNLYSMNNKLVKVPIQSCIVMEN